MNNVLKIIVITLIVSCGRSGVPIVDFAETRFVEPEQYEQMLEENLEKSLRRNPNLTRDSEEIYLRHLVIGLSFDVRFGLWNWRKGLSSGIEMHMNAPEVPYAN